VYGAAQPRESPASLWYTRRAIARGAHVIEQNMSIAEAVAQRKMKVPHVEFPRDVEAERRISQRLSEAGVRAFAILNPGAGWGAKRWPAERYGRVARTLAAGGIHAILNYGPGEEELASAAEAASGGTARAMSCTVIRSSITELIALTRRARLFVGGDTGPLHLASALQVPVVGIYGPTDPARNGPYGTRSVVLRSSESVTLHTRRAEADEGMLAIGSEEVVAAANKLLDGASR